MKHIKDLLEGVLDDSDIVLGKVENELSVKKIRKKFEDSHKWGVMSRSHRDMMENEIEVGDLVIFTYGGRMYCDLVTGFKEDKGGWTWLILNEFDRDTIAPIITIRVKKNQFANLLKIISK